MRTNSALIVQDDITNWIQSYPMKTIFPSQTTDIIYTQFQGVYSSLSRFTMESRNERGGRKSRPQSERRNSCFTRAKRTARRMVGLCDGMLRLLSKRARQDGRWQDSIGEQIWPELWRTSNSFWNIGWVHPHHRERQVKSTSVWKQSLSWIVPLKDMFLCSVPRAGRGWSGDLMIADCEDLHKSEASVI